MEHPHFPCPKVPRKHHNLRYRLRDDLVHTKYIDEEKEKEPRPEESPKGNAEDDEKLPLAAMFAPVKDPEDTEKMIPRKSQHVSHECRDGVVRVKPYDKDAVHNEINDSGTPPHEEIAEELHVARSGTTDEEMTHAP